MPLEARAPTWDWAVQTHAAFRHAAQFLTPTSILVVLTAEANPDTVKALLCPPATTLRALSVVHTTTELGVAQLGACLLQMQQCTCAIEP